MTSNARYIFIALLLTPVPCLAARRLQAAQSPGKTDVRSLPSIMHFCDNEHCATLRLQGDHFVVDMPNSCCANGSVWTVSSFQRDLIILNRTDTSGFKAFYKGQISPDGNSLINAVSGGRPFTSDWKAGRDTAYQNFWLAWGDAITSLPANGRGVTGPVNARGQQSSGGAALAVTSNQNGAPAKPRATTTADNRSGDYPSPPTGIPPVHGNRHLTINLNGNYSSFYVSPMAQIGIRVRQNGVNIEAELLDDNYKGTGTNFFEGTFDPGSSIAHGRVLDMNAFSVLTGVNAGTYHDDVLGTVDLDHLAVPNHAPFERETPPAYNDIPCSLANELKVGAKWAYMRAAVAQRNKDLPTSVCWMYAAAIQGDAKAAFYLAYFIHDGLGTTANPSLAFQWALKGAQGGDAKAAYLVGILYDRGDGVAQSSKDASFWRQRGDAIKEQQKRDAESAHRAEQQQDRETIVLAGVTVVALAFLADEMLSTHLCDSHSVDDPSEQNYIREQLREKGLHCVEGEPEPVPIK